MANSELEVFLCCHALRWWVIEIDVWGCPLIYVYRVLSLFISQVGDERLAHLNLRRLNDWSNLFVFISSERVIRARSFCAGLSSKERLLQVYLSLVRPYINTTVLFPQFLVQMPLLLHEFRFVVSQLLIIYWYVWRSFVRLTFLCSKVGFHRRVLRFEPLWRTYSLVIQLKGNTFRFVEFNVILSYCVIKGEVCAYLVLGLCA